MVSPPTLSATGPAGKKRSGDIQDYERDGTIPSAFPQLWTRPEVRGALCAMQGRVCAYCGADLGEAGIDVDHFRPKGSVDGESTSGGYWWLAYEFSNYLLSCIVCNQKCKRNRFPLEDGAGRVGYHDRHLLPEERRILLDPTSDDVEGWLSFDWRKPAGRVIANPALAPMLARRVDQVLLFFRVNRRAAQRKKRAAIQQLVIEKIGQGKVDEIRTLAIRYRPHSIVARQILESTAPQALPTPQEELQWLLEELSSELILKLEDLNDPSLSSDVDEKEAKELLWALAVLWKDPPAGTAEFIAEILDRRGLKDLVSEYLELL